MCWIRVKFNCGHQLYYSQTVENCYVGQGPRHISFSQTFSKSKMCACCKYALTEETQYIAVKFGVPNFRFYLTNYQQADWDEAADRLERWSTARGLAYISSKWDAHVADPDNEDLKIPYLNLPDSEDKESEVETE